MADTKISALTELTAPVAADLLAIVDDPAGTPVSKKITVSNLLASLPGDLDVAGNSIVSSSNGDITLAPNGTGNVVLSGASITGGAGTITADDPIFDVSETWNNGAVTFTAFAMDVTDTASASGSLLANWSIDTVSVFAVGKDGRVYLNNGLHDLYDNSNVLTVEGNSGVTIQAAASNGPITLTPNGTGNVVLGNYTLDADATVGAGQDNYVLTYDDASGTWGPEAAAGGGGSPAGSSGDLQFNDSSSFGGSILKQASTALIEQRNSTTAQTFNVYNTYTDASNYERLEVKWDTNVATIQGVAAGTGTQRDMDIIGSTSTVGTALTINATPNRSSGTSYLYLHAGSTNTGITINNFRTTANHDFAPVATNSINLGSASLTWQEVFSKVYRLSSGTTVASLPTAVVGKIARVTDADTPAVGSTVAGGGAAAALVWYNGSNWTVIGV